MQFVDTPVPFGFLCAKFFFVPTKTARILAWHPTAPASRAPLVSTYAVYELCHRWICEIQFKHMWNISSGVSSYTVLLAFLVSMHFFPLRLQVRTFHLDTAGIQVFVWITVNTIRWVAAGCWVENCSNWPRCFYTFAHTLCTLKKSRLLYNISLNIFTWHTIRHQCNT